MTNYGGTFFCDVYGAPFFILVLLKNQLFPGSYSLQFFSDL